MRKTIVGKNIGLALLIIVFGSIGITGVEYLGGKPESIIVNIIFSWSTCLYVFCKASLEIRQLEER